MSQLGNKINTSGIPGDGLKVWARVSKVGKRSLSMTVSLFILSRCVKTQHVKDVVLQNHLLSEHQGFLYRKKKKKKRQWKSLAKWGKTSEMLESKTVQVL